MVSVTDKLRQLAGRVPLLYYDLVTRKPVHSLGSVIESKKYEGALDRARTDDLRLIRATRYQLRYESSTLMSNNFKVATCTSAQQPLVPFFDSPGAQDPASRKFLPVLVPMCRRFQRSGM